MYFSRKTKQFLNKEAFKIVTKAVISEEREPLNLLRRNDFIKEMKEEGFSRRQALETFKEYDNRTLDTTGLTPKTIDLLTRRRGYDPRIDPYLVKKDDFYKKMEKKGFSKEESRDIIQDFKYDRFVEGTKKEIEDRLKIESGTRDIKRLKTRTIHYEFYIECCRDGMVVYSSVPKSGTKSETALEFPNSLEGWEAEYLEAIEELFTPAAEEKCDSIAPGSVRLCNFVISGTAQEFDDGVI